MEDYLAYIKIPVTASGLYKITGQRISQNINNVANYSANQFRIFFSGGKSLPYDLRQPRVEWQEVPTVFEDNGNGIWDANDQLLFYAIANPCWDYQKNTGSSSIYDDTTWYWLVLDSQPRRTEIPLRSTPVDIPTQSSQSSAMHTIYLEQNLLLHPLGNGINWYWAKISATSAQSFSASLETAAPAADSTALLTVQFYRNSGGTSQRIQISFNGQLVKDTFVYIPINDSKIKFPISQGSMLAGTNQLQMNFPGSITQDLYINALSLEYQERLELDGGRNHESFSPIDADSESRTLQYSLKNDSSPPDFLLGISDIFHPQRFQPLLQGQSLFIQLNPAESLQLKALYRSQILQPTRLESVNWAYLRRPDQSATYVMICHPIFISEAERLAQFYRQRDGITVRVINVADIYHEFGWGAHEPVALRDFLYYASNTWNQQQERLQYALFFGDGNADFRGTLSDVVVSRLPVWETSFTTPDGYLVSDDFFAFFLNSAGTAMDETFPQLAIGRIPVTSTTEARSVVDKLISFQTRKSSDYWRDGIVISADDEDNIQYPNEVEVMHTVNTENLIIPNIPDFMLKEKIYLMNYSKLVKPQARVDLRNALNEGALLFNWTGHGSWERLAHETIFQGSEDVQRLTNQNKYFLFYASACDVGRYDMLNGYCLAEKLLLQADAGAIACIASNRASFPGTNESLNGLFLLYALKYGLPIGQALSMAKMAYHPSLTNNRQYNLLGDPYLTLLRPGYRINIPLDRSDSLVAGDPITITAPVEALSQTLGEPSGKTQVVLQNPDRAIVYQIPNYTPVTYQLPGFILFHGFSEIENFTVQARLIVPLDLGFQSGTALLKYYQPGDYEVDGFYNRLRLTGKSSSRTDTTAPELTVSFDYLPAPEQKEIQITPNSVLSIRFYDENGINQTGLPGHQIMLMIDDDTQQRIDLTPYFQNEANSYQEGSLTYHFQSLSIGYHTFLFRCYDNFNNPAEKQLNVLVQNKSRIELQQVYNYPNPFRSSTQFVLETNTGGTATIEIYTMTGRRIMRFERVAAVGQNIFEWDGRDWAGDELAAGTYFYRITVREPFTGSQKNQINKLVKIR